jgi:membrane-associated protein
VNEVLDAILGAVQSVDPVLRVLVAGLGMLFETSILLGLVVPGDSIVLVSSTAVSDVGQYIALLLAVIVGSLAGESIGFGLGRWFGPRIRGSRLGARIGERNWARAERYLSRRGGIAILVSRFLPVLHSLIPVTVGMSPMPYRRFLSWTAPACIVWAVAYVSVGAAAAGGYREVSDRLHIAGYLFAGIIALFAIVAVLVKKLLERAEKKHLDRDPDPDEETRAVTR